jgi:pyridoxal 5'-phosphate synthase pdxS subunit
VKRGMAEMLNGGVIMDVATPEQAETAEDAGAVAVDDAGSGWRPTSGPRGGVSRMSDPDMIDGIIAAVSIPVMAKARIGHFVQAQVLQNSTSTTSTSRRCSLPPTTPATSTSERSPCRSCAGPPT